jgi:hypothetical protein
MKEIFELKMKKADKAEINERKIQVTSWSKFHLLAWLGIRDPHGSALLWEAGYGSALE